MPQRPCASSLPPQAHAAARAGAAIGLALVMATSAAPAWAAFDPGTVAGGAYRLDEHESALVAVVGFGGLFRAKVRFGRLQGVLVHDPRDMRRSRVSIAVDAASAETGQNGFNGVAAAALGAGRFPTISFVSKGLTPDDQGGELDGELTLHGVTRPMRLRVTGVELASPGPGRPLTLHFSGKGRIRRSDYGVGTPGPLTRDAVELRFDVIFVRQDVPQETAPPVLARRGR